jgi:hypothetical protein
MKDEFENSIEIMSIKNRLCIDEIILIIESIVLLVISIKR